MKTPKIVATKWEDKDTDIITRYEMDKASNSEKKK